jgi:peroxiredoxin
MWIRGEISNLEVPYILISYPSADTLALDTVTVDAKGKFHYENPIDTLTTFSLYLNNYESAAVVFADKGQNLKVRGNALMPDLIEVNGNEINNDLTLFKAENRELLEQRAQLLMHLAGRDEIAKLRLLNYELTSKAEDFVSANPTRYASLILISNFFMDSDNPAALERVMAYLKGDVTRTMLAARLKSYSEKINRSAEGAQMPYFALEDKDGKTIHSHQFTGKYLLLSFLSATSAESRQTVSLLKEVYQQINKNNVEFLTIYIDSDSPPVKYAENDSIPWKIALETKSWGADVADAYNVQYTPFTVLIAPSGAIKARNIPVQEVQAATGNATGK